MFSNSPSSPSRSTMQNNDSQRADYLEIIQGVIQRMSHMSFLIKGWTIVVFYTMMTGDSRAQLMFVGAAVFFWGLDAYYLGQERRFRKLYDAAAEEGSRVPLFLLDMKRLTTFGIEIPRPSLMRTFISPTVALLHLPLIGLAVGSFFVSDTGRPWWDLMVLEMQRMMW
jgi:hypothetical protein